MAATAEDATAARVAGRRSICLARKAQTPLASIIPIIMDPAEFYQRGIRIIPSVLVLTKSAAKNLGGAHRADFLASICN